MHAFEDQHLTLEYCLSFLGGYWIHMGGLNGSLKVGEPGVGPTPPSPPQQKAESLRLHFCFWKNVC